VFIPWLGGLVTSIHGGIIVEEVECIETENRQFLGDDLYIVPTTSFKPMPLLFWYEFAPDIGICLKPFVGSREKDIMRQNIVITKG